MSVPPTAERLSTYLTAFRMAAVVTGCGEEKRERTVLLNWMTLNRSWVVNRVRAEASEALACSIEGPAIDPDVSMTKVRSRGMWGAASFCCVGGTSSNIA